MRRHLRNLIRCIALPVFGALAAAAQTAAPANTYTNPVIASGGGADPAVVLVGDTYYLYSTNPDNVVFVSSDLVHWQKGPQILPPGFKGVWAPEVYRHPEDGRFYLYYTLRYKIGVAVSDRPDALFTDLGFLALPGIDAHPFRDDDGRLYLYFTHTPPFTMYCVPMKGPTETGGPVTKCFEISQEWEQHSFAINEGPWMEKRDGSYTLLYSGSNGQSVHYAVGAASAPTPIGPFAKYEGNPVFRGNEAIHGPGHGSVTRDRAGNLWHVYHQKRDASIGWKRDICLDRLIYDDQGVLRGQPTRGQPQPAPVTDPALVWCPEISPRGAVFTNQAVVTLTCRTGGAAIHYTVDDTEPTRASPRYAQPFTLQRSTTVRARAWRDGMHDSTIASMRFTRTDARLPDNPAPHAAPGDFPFDVFARPAMQWTNLVTKPINTQRRSR